RPEGEERRRRLVFLAAGRQLLEADRRRAQFLDEARLADAGLADELDDPARAAARLLDRRTQHRELLVAPDERQLRRRRLLLELEQLAEPEGIDRTLLALHEERLRLRVEARARALQHLGARKDLAGLRARRKPRCGVDRVAHDRVRAAELRADRAREDGSAVYARREGDRDAGVEDRAHRAQHPLLLAARAHRRTRDEIDLAAVAVDVGFE